MCKTRNTENDKSKIGYSIIIVTDKNIKSTIMIIIIYSKGKKEKFIQNCVNNNNDNNVNCLPELHYTTWSHVHSMVCNIVTSLRVAPAFFFSLLWILFLLPRHARFLPFHTDYTSRLVFKVEIRNYALIIYTDTHALTHIAFHFQTLIHISSSIIFLGMITLLHVLAIEHKIISYTWEDEGITSSHSLPSLIVSKYPTL